MPKGIHFQTFILLRMCHETGGICFLFYTTSIVTTWVESLRTYKILISVERLVFFTFVFGFDISWLDRSGSVWTAWSLILRSCEINTKTLNATLDRFLFVFFFLLYPLLPIYYYGSFVIWIMMFILLAWSVILQSLRFRVSFLFSFHFYSRYRDPCSASIDEDDLHTTKLIGDPQKRVSIVLNINREITWLFCFSFLLSLYL